MSQTILQQLADFGQSVWLDYIDRPMLENGDLKKRIEGGLRGMTSNPSIFNNAIGSSNDYDAKIVQLKGEGKSTFEIYDELSIKDIQDACDLFTPVYKETKRLDGYVSLEINPLLARKTDEQTQEGLRLFKKVNRPNVMIKVPSTDEGILVFEELIAQGVNVNVTLIFSQEQYTKTAEAYFNGLRKLAENGGNLSEVRSVASVFVSRVDSAVDALIDSKAKQLKEDLIKAKLMEAKGQAAVANCRIIFEKFEELIAGGTFKSLADKGANIQRVLWGSTSTKNPDYNDVKYVTELIASPTVNTIPEKTLAAFVDHGEVKDAFKNYKTEDAERVLNVLGEFDIDIHQVCAQLLSDGCDAFDQAFETLLDSIDKKARELVAK